MAERPGEMDERDVDERFASIVARWEAAEPAPPADPAAPTGTTVADPASPTGTTVADPPAPPPDVAAARSGADPTAVPATEPVDDERSAGAQGRADPPRSVWVAPSPLEQIAGPTSWRAATPADDDARAAASAAEAALEDEHFEPPDVTLPPQEDLHFWGAVIGLVAGPLMLLYVVFARPFHSTRWFAASVLVSLVGFALLVLRQPTDRDEHESDNGARI